MNLFLRAFPMDFIGNFVKELRGLLSYVYLLQSSIDYWSQLHPMDEDTVVYRGIPLIGPTLAVLYESVVGEIVLWRSFTSTSRRIEIAVHSFAKNRTGILFEIALHPGCAAADISSFSDHAESEVLIAAYTAFHVDSVDEYHIPSAVSESGEEEILPFVKLSFAFSWFDFDLES
jgi:hypothetical protein